MALIVGAAMSMLAKVYARCQIDESSKSTNNRWNPSNVSPPGTLSEKSLTSSRNVNGLKWISPTAGVTPRVAGISFINSARSNLGTSTKPAKAYRPSSAAMIAAIRKVFVLMSCSK